MSRKDGRPRFVPDLSPAASLTAAEQERERVEYLAEQARLVDSEALVQVFTFHLFHPVSWRCTCGWVHPQYGSRSLDPMYLRRHLADAVMDAGFHR